VTSRDRVMESLRFRTTDRVPLDLGGMRSTGISAFAYPGLRTALGLPARRGRLYDTGQMLALPERDVLDALGCDVVHVTLDECTNAFEEPARWKPHGFNGRLDALVPRPEAFTVQPDGTIAQRREDGRVSRMVPGSYVFDTEHAGEPLDLEAEIAEPDWDAKRRELDQRSFSEERVAAVAVYCRRVRESTDRAVFLNGWQSAIGFPGGMAAFSMLCLLHPQWVREVHRMEADHMARQAALLLPAVAEYVDVVMLAADDQGTQNGPILPPAVFRDLYVPAYRRITDACHRAAPGLKLFLHSCGAIFDLLPHVIEAGFDVLNPVQWSAGGRSWAAWKDACRGRISLWGGGVNTQRTLPLGTITEVERETREAASCLSEGGGYVFAAIHNILAEIDPRKTVAMYRTAAGIVPRQVSPAG
jgi:uroporphyrinogen decarboxylase